MGHLLECAAQVSGGYLADPGRVDVPDLHRVGFPLAEVQADGTGRHHQVAGHRRTRGPTELHGATVVRGGGTRPAYLQADVTGDFSQVCFAGLGDDRVRVERATGRARPERLKVSLGYVDGFIGEGQISYAGPGARERGELALKILRQRLANPALSPSLEGLERRAEMIGVNAMHGPELGKDREPYEVRVRLAVRCDTRAQAERVGHEVEALYLNGPAGRWRRHPVGARGWWRWPRP